MGLFDRRKDAKHSATSTPEPAEQPTAPAPPPGPQPVASEVKEMKMAEEPKVAAAPPSPPRAPRATEPEPAPEPPAAPTPSAPTTEIHTVAAGESLADLASRYGVQAEEIARQNHLPPPGQIHAGQVFVITTG